MRWNNGVWLAFLPIMLGACSGIQHQKGLLLTSKHGLNVDPSDDYPFVAEDPEHLEGDLLLPAGAPITIRLGGKAPETNFLAVGPLVFPVIPWPAGMVRASLKNKWQEPGNFQVAIGPDRSSLIWRNHQPEITKFTFDPKRVELSNQSRPVRLVSSKASAYSVYQVRQGKWDRSDMTAECISETKDGSFVFNVANNHCAGMTVTLTYDMPYSDLTEGTLQVGGVEINSEPIRVPSTTLRPAGRFRVWGCCTIND